MTKKHVALFVATLLLASFLSALVAYRRGKRDAARIPPLANATTSQTPNGCVDFRDAASRLGQTTCVSGRVLRVFTSRAENTFVDFCPDYRDCPFSTVIFSSDREKFGDVGSLTGRAVEIDGQITTYQGRPQIIIRDPKQIRVLP